jgi:hypothetical protein
MADTDQNALPAPDSGAQDTGAGDNGAQDNGLQLAGSINADQSAAPTSCSDVVWVVSAISPPTDISPVDRAGADQLGDDADHILAATATSETPGNLDHALDQLTTATDLFDVPVFDFHSS